MTKIFIFDGLSRRRFDLSKYLCGKQENQVFFVEPEKEKYDAECSVDSGFEKLRNKFYEIEQQNVNSCSIVLRKNHQGLYQIMDELCISCAAEYFKRLEMNILQTTHDIQNVMDNADILPDFSPFFMYLLKILEQAGYLVMADGKVTVIKPLEMIPKPEEVILRLTDDQKAFLPYMELLIHCSANYVEAFSGAIPANDVLYPGGSYEMVNEVDRRIPAATKRDIYQKILSDILKVIVMTGKKTVRILEIGAGSGAFTEKMLAQIDGLDIQYFFTDIGQSFVANAKQRAVQDNINYMEFMKLDISGEIEEQGFHANSFDLVLGYDVLQATSNIERSLKNIKTLLVPGGVLALIQSYDMHPIDNMIYGLAPGWWNYTADPIGRDTIVMPPERWKNVLENNQFREVIVLPENYGTSDCAILVGINEKETPDVKRDLNQTLQQKMYDYFCGCGAECHLKFIKNYNEQTVNKFVGGIRTEGAEVVLAKYFYEADDMPIETEMDHIAVKVVSIFNETLGLEQISIEDQLFDIGYDSHASLLLITRIRQEFQIELSIKDFYGFEKVSQIVDYVRTAAPLQQEIIETQAAEEKNIDDLLAML